MVKCGKGCMPECEYFTTGGCISPFNCPYKIETGYINSATSIPTYMEQHNGMSVDDAWQELEDGDETKSVSAGLLVGELVAAIISARHKQKLSQADLAQKMNVSVSCIRRMEELNSMPRIDTVFQAALVLGVLNAKWRKTDD